MKALSNLNELLCFDSRIMNNANFCSEKAISQVLELKRLRNTRMHLIPFCAFLIRRCDQNRISISLHYICNVR